MKCTQSVSHYLITPTGIYTLHILLLLLAPTAFRVIMCIVIAQKIERKKRVFERLALIQLNLRLGIGRETDVVARGKAFHGMILGLM